MNPQHIKKIAVAITVSIIFIGLLILRFQPQTTEIEQHSYLTYNTGRIVSLVADNTIAPYDPDAVVHFRQGNMIFEVEMLRGTFAGEIFEANYQMNSPMHVVFEIGDLVSVRIFEFQGEIMITEIRYPERIPWLFALIGLFILFLCVIGGKRGVLSVLGLVFTLICVTLLLIPLISRGFPVLPITLLILLLVTVVTISLLGGLEAKGISAILGSLSGVLVAAGLAAAFGRLLHISGYNMANYRALTHLTDGAQISGLFISSVLVASIGAVMDASMSVASAMEEVKNAKPNVSQKALFAAGLNVSRDVMGTMSSTLILAFLGGSLAMMIFMYASDMTFNQFLNNDMMSIEIVMGIAGSFGIILAAPLTALICSKLLKIQK